MLHHYTAADIARCLGSEPLGKEPSKPKRVLLVGDSTIRQVFWALARRLDEAAATEALHSVERHVDISFERAAVRLEFLWDPFLNSTNLLHELSSYKQRINGEANETLIGTESPALMLVGGGSWFARYVDPFPIQSWKNTIETLFDDLPPRNLSAYAEECLEGVTKAECKDLLLFSPVHVPWYDILSGERAATLVPYKVEAMNAALKQVAHQRRIDVAWVFNNMTTVGRKAYDGSGIHVIQSVADRQADILLNMRCNTLLTLKGPFPNDKTCCDSYGSSRENNKFISANLFLQASIFIVRLLTHTFIIKFLETPEGLSGRAHRLMTTN